MDSRPPSHAEWVALEGATLTVADGTDGTEVTLRRVSEVAEQGPFHSFRLLFDAPADHEHVQGTLQFTHADLGSAELFVVTIGADDNGRTYEAVISQRRDVESTDA